MNWPGRRLIGHPYCGLLLFGCAMVLEVAVLVVLPMANGASVRLWLLAVALSGVLTFIGFMHLISEAIDLRDAMDSRRHESPPSA